MTRGMTDPGDPLIKDVPPDRDWASIFWCTLIGLTIGVGIVALVVYASGRDERYHQRIQACVDKGGQVKYDNQNYYQSCILPPGVHL